MQSIFEILFLIGNPGKFLRGKSLSRGKSNLLHLGMEGRGKLKFGEVSLQIRQNFFERKSSKKIPDLNVFLKAMVVLTLAKP